MSLGASPFRSIALAASLALAAACSSAGGNELAKLDEEPIDPALTSALEDPILVDRDLVQQAHPNSMRPPEMPIQAQYPAGLALATAGLPCGSIEPGERWAGRMPAAFLAYPGGRITGSSGSDSGDCRVRIVTFRTDDSFERVLLHYRTAAARAGFSTRHQQRGSDHLLAGVREAGGGFALVVTPLDLGSDVALIVNAG